MARSQARTRIFSRSSQRGHRLRLLSLAALPRSGDSGRAPGPELGAGASAVAGWAGSPVGVDPPADFALALGDGTACLVD